MKRLLLVAGALALTLSAPAVADPPGATTGQATSVTDTTAVLNGTVFPNKEETSYHFEYGTTTGYGASTPSTSAGGGNAGKDASASVSGLAPSTTYHFRLVATNASGQDFGADATFTTLAPGAAPPPANTVSATASATTVRFGRAVTVTGQVTGQGAGGAEVTLLHSPYPFTDPFKPAAPAVTADATGRYSVTVAPALNTRYQASAKTSPPVTSPVIAVSVRPAISLRVSDSTVRRGRRVRLSGTVAPAHDGASVQIQRRTRRGWRSVATTVLRASKTAGRSAYARRVRVRSTAKWRVRLAAHADHATGTSRARRIRAR